MKSGPSSIGILARCRDSAHRAATVTRALKCFTLWRRKVSKQSVLFCYMRKVNSTLQTKIPEAQSRQCQRAVMKQTSVVGCCFSPPPSLRLWRRPSLRMIFQTREWKAGRDSRLGWQVCGCSSKTSFLLLNKLQPGEANQDVCHR